MILFPPCKINIGLHVLGKRPDGYHSLETLMYPVPMTDVLEVISSDNFSFSSSGLTIPGSLDSNLCVKAFQLFQSKFGISNVSIHLHKIIPMGGGLGGGSSDGTYTLLALNELFSLGLSNDTLRDFAAELGSDCPFFVENIPQIVKGRGEFVSPTSFRLKGYFLKVVNVGIHISTKEAFSVVNYYGKKEVAFESYFNTGIEALSAVVENSFEGPIFLKHPVLAQIKQRMYDNNAVFAAMSGSGSTMYGIFKDQPSDSMFEDLKPSFEEVVQLS
jgi:4-diphosphocytidyl-2-C-methyl-D-erythritol kinase